jgi:hypothetical protein
MRTEAPPSPLSSGPQWRDLRFCDFSKSPGRRVRTRAARVPKQRRGGEVCALSALCALSPRRIGGKCAL